jgi:hypothetical protein
MSRIEHGTVTAMSLMIVMLPIELCVFTEIPLFYQFSRSWMIISSGSAVPSAGGFLD